MFPKNWQRFKSKFLNLFFFHLDNGTNPSAPLIPPAISSIGDQISEVLIQSSIGVVPEDLKMINKIGDKFFEAYKIGPTIVCNEELVAYMSLDD